MKYEWKKLLTRGMLLLFALCAAVNGYLFYTSQSLLFSHIFQGDYASYLEALEQLQENPDIPVFLIGHSMGGFTVSLYGVKYPDKNLRGSITSGALTHDNGKLITGIPKGMDPHEKLPNELGSGVCSVAEVVDWYGKDPYNTQTFTAGLVYALCDGLEWFQDKVSSFSFPVLMLHGENDGLVSKEDTYAFFAAAASKDKQMKIYGNLFHEIFNEYCKDEVIDDVLAWINRRI